MFMINSETAPVELQGCLCPTEFQSTVVDGRIHHAFVDHIEAGIAERRLNRVGTIPLIENVFVGKHLRLSRLVGFHSPVHHIDPMGEKSVMAPPPKFQNHRQWLNFSSLKG